MQTLRLVLPAIALVAAASFCVTAQAANTAPAIDAFRAAFASVNDYTYKMHSHEIMGTRVQDRIYDYSYMKPHFAKTYIEAGDGQGSGGVWAGGDEVSGHQGGLLSFVHLKISVHD